MVKESLSNNDFIVLTRLAVRQVSWYASASWESIDKNGVQESIKISLDKERVCYYRETSSISRPKSQSLNVSCILMQLFSLNPLKPGVKLRMKM